MMLTGIVLGDVAFAAFAGIALVAYGPKVHKDAPDIFCEPRFWLALNAGLMAGGGFVGWLL